jgi:hypothetical protein
LERRGRGPRSADSPAVLEPDLDLLGLDVAECGAVPDDLLAAQRAGLGAVAVDPLEHLHLLGGVAHVLARVHLRRPRRRPVLAAARRHHRRHLAGVSARGGRESVAGGGGRRRSATATGDAKSCPRDGSAAARRHGGGGWALACRAAAALGCGGGAEQGKGKVERDGREQERSGGWFGLIVTGSRSV